MYNWKLNYKNESFTFTHTFTQILQTVNVCSLSPLQVRPWAHQSIKTGTKNVSAWCSYVVKFALDVLKRGFRVVKAL